MTLEEILTLPDNAQKIYYLKRVRKTDNPDALRLFNDWNPDKHEIMVDTVKYPKVKIVTEKEQKQFDPATGRTLTIPEKTKDVEPNRIALPLEQDIVNIHTAFTIGNEPKMNCDPDEPEKPLLEAIRKVLAKNKIKYQNKRIVRAWLAEQECCEYWYTVPDDGFWRSLGRRIKGLFGGSAPSTRLKSALWSPFRGDKLYPFFDSANNLIAMSREYVRREIDDTETTCFMTVTADSVYQWESKTGWQEVKVFRHGFGKLPVLYCYRPQAYCEKIRTLRIRLEKLLSNYADCIDYHFFPILMLFGDVENFSGEFKSRVVELTGQGANAQYLTWDQVPETVKYEAETLINQIYALTNTPRISFDSLKGTGNALSGVAFDYVFLSTHLAVENHAEIIGDFMQRRVNLLVSALASINPSLRKAAETIDIDVEIQPYRLDNIEDNVRVAVSAVQGGVWSKKHGVMFAGNADRVEEELAQMAKENTSAEKTLNKQPIVKTEPAKKEDESSTNQ